MNGWHKAVPLTCIKNVNQHIWYKIYNINYADVSQAVVITEELH